MSGKRQGVKGKFQTQNAEALGARHRLSAPRKPFDPDATVGAIIKPSVRLCGP
jgi:hypothetical protein